MKFHIRDEAGAIIVSCEGQLDFSANETFEGLIDDLRARKPRRLIFDLSGVTGIDSVGLGLLYIAKEEMDDLGATMALSKAQGYVVKMLDLTAASQTFEIL